MNDEHDNRLDDRAILEKLRPMLKAPDGYKWASTGRRARNGAVRHLTRYGGPGLTTVALCGVLVKVGFWPTIEKDEEHRICYRCGSLKGLELRHANRAEEPTEERIPEDSGEVFPPIDEAEED